MMAIISNKFCNEVLRALGLEGRPITKLVITLESNRVAEVQITEMIEQDSADRFVAVARDFYLMPNTDANSQ